MYPQLAPVQHLPRNAVPIGDGYTLLHKVDSMARSIHPCKENALRDRLLQDDFGWAARIVKICYNSCTEFAEVQYYFSMKDKNNIRQTLVMVYMFEPPDKKMLDDSMETVWAIASMTDSALQAIPLGAGLGENKPYDQPAFVRGWNYFLVERLGLDIVFKVHGQEDSENSDQED
ncbi:hypothetical protein K488DRAFT_74762 [Vararia minispora EC-137]|uniref:Uncharacterized protein n=1 Tax=Vararia minispora EC-137 TaxID=1314806 RepID=A0ACB8Q6A7_9AGAM|nr:hypothetical protein K488DRAFT_74762 [Vararia minispora EC-137]